ncbi:MAG: hypothetical protein HC894_29210, partial [Microcoleus sp. SM1_3_4]|nr:hypothetical protein [Microcoleus sp. SM1_3_4]
QRRGEGNWELRSAGFQSRFALDRASNGGCNCNCAFELKPPLFAGDRNQQPPSIPDP